MRCNWFLLHPGSKVGAVYIIAKGDKGWGTAWLGRDEKAFLGVDNFYASEEIGLGFSEKIYNTSK